jgi:CheY-like chemotaxis protein
MPRAARRTLGARLAHDRSHEVIHSAPPLQAHRRSVLSFLMPSVAVAIKTPPTIASSAPHRQPSCRLGGAGGQITTPLETRLPVTSYRDRSRKQQLPNVIILLVDDEPLVRLTLAQELRQAGLEVHEAENGDEASALIRKLPAAFSLLVTDIHMPGQSDGLQVAALMRSRTPDAPVVYITGRPEAVGHLGPKEVLLPKPFTPSDLLRTIRELLPGT